jgi:excisionase family DNA binding protein
MSDDINRPKFERQFLSPSEIAQLTGIDVSLIRKAIRNGELRAMRMSNAPNSKMRVRQADLWEWVKSKQRTPLE